MDTAEYRRPMLGDLLDWSDPINQGLVGYWPLTEGAGGTAVDFAGNNDGTWNGTGVHHAGSARGNVGQFNGSDDYVDIGAVPASLRFTETDPYSISAWINLPSTPSNTLSPIFSSSVAAAGAYYMGYNKNHAAFNNAAIYGEYFDGTNFISATTPVNSVAVGSGWRHVVLVNDGSNANSALSIFLDGISQTITNRTSSGGPTVAINYTGAVTNIGGRDSGTSEWDGLLSVARIYNIAHTAEWVHNLYLRTK